MMTSLFGDKLTCVVPFLPAAISCNGSGASAAAGGGLPLHFARQFCRLNAIVVKPTHSNIDNIAMRGGATYIKKYHPSLQCEAKT